MATVLEQLDAVPGFTAPVHRALSEPILLGGAPRSVAILNGTLAGAIGLGLQLWLAGILIWALGHVAAVWAAKVTWVRMGLRLSHCASTMTIMTTRPAMNSRKSIVRLVLEHTTHRPATSVRPSSHSPHKGPVRWSAHI